MSDDWGNKLNKQKAQKAAVDELVILPDDLEIKSWPPEPSTGMRTGTVEPGIIVCHKPTGIMISCEEHRSQHKNKAVAISNLKNILSKMN